MLVVIANDLPPAVRGRMKLWFIEPKPNVFVSSIKDSVAENVMNYLYEHCPQESGILLIRSLPKQPGYEVYSVGPTKKKLSRLSGLQLIVERTDNNH